MPCKTCKFMRDEYSNKYFVCVKKNILLKKKYNQKNECDDYVLFFRWGVKMVLCKKTLKRIFKREYKEEDYTPNGIDLRLKNAQICLDNPDDLYGFDSEGNKKLPNTVDLSTEQDGSYHFQPNTRYLWNLGKNRYPGVIGLFFLRSTIMRSGGKLFSSVADMGYEGDIIVGFETSNHISIPKDERVVQCIFLELDDNSGESYHGDYQNNKIYEQMRLWGDIMTQFNCFVDEWGSFYYIPNEIFEQWCENHPTLTEWIHEVDAITLTTIDEVEEQLEFIKQCDDD